MALIKSAAAMLAELEHLPDDRRAWTREQRTALSTREAQCLARADAGQTGHQMAAELGIARTTAHTHVHRATRKLVASGRGRPREVRLTHAQRLVLSYRAAGLSYLDMAARTGCTTGALSSHMSRARRKLRCTTYPEAIRVARERGLLFESIVPNREATS